MPSTGHYIKTTVGGETVEAFVPNPLPPDPMPNLGPEGEELMGEANRALGRLDGISRLLPDPLLFLYFYVRKEAVLSSQIEGTQSSLSDLLLFEREGEAEAAAQDVREVSNYVAAMDHGLRRLREDGFPISLRLFRELHGILMSSGRGHDKAPGEFRRTQNWIGGSRPGNARFVPPPPDKAGECMGQLELFLHDQFGKTPVLLKAAFAHVQFETIHPFLDGNGRLGRLLITFILCAEHAIREPLLYLSYFFKKNRNEYYDLLQSVRTNGNWEGWLRYFLTGVVETADDSVQAAQKILALFEHDRLRIGELGRRSGSALRVHQLLQRHPYLNAREIVERAGLSHPTALTTLKDLEGLNIVRVQKRSRRGQIYAYQSYIDILSEGTEPL
ncbi:MAG: Fic family protein [Candidatus Zixiibacteriota bacterium]